MGSFDVKYLGFDDLERDGEFMNGLRNRAYCLIIGAGFSYGIRNQMNSEREADNYIPLSDHFVEISKLFFNDESIREYTIAATRWSLFVKSADNEQERTNRFNLFKKLFLADREAFEMNHQKLFRNILLPRWARIYTFNIDNVLDILSEGDESIIIENKDAGSFPMNGELHIGYVHGSIVRAKSIDDLSLGTAGYGKNANLKHNLYHALGNDIATHDYHLIVAGYQFSELMLVVNVLNGLKRSAFLKIYFINPNADLSVIKDSASDWSFDTEVYVIQSTNTAFLEFLERHESFLEFSPFGSEALLLNGSFINSLKKEQINKTMFFTGKDIDNCQWYGVIEGWDFRRRQYPELLNTVIDSYEKSWNKGVVAFIHGAGGSGKSTILRRLAIDCCHKDLKVVWALSPVNLTEPLIRLLHRYPQRKFLLIIEDWQIIANNEAWINEQLTYLFTFDNLRIVVGHRHNIPGVYEINPGEIFKLTIDPAENTEIISKIRQENPKWRSVIDGVMQMQGVNTTALFILLYIITREVSAEGEGKDPVYQNVGQKFRAIVSHDMNQIAQNNYGLAVALYYFSCWYSDKLSYIEKATFLNIAEYYNKVKGRIGQSNPFDTDSMVYPYLSHYVAVSGHSLGSEAQYSLEAVKFNHDLLATCGIREALDGFRFDPEPYNKKIKRELLEIITDEGGHDYTASAFLFAFLMHEKDLFKDDTERLYFIMKLYNRNCKHHGYLRYLFRDECAFSWEIKRELLLSIIHRSENEEMLDEVLSKSLRHLREEDYVIQYAGKCLEYYPERNSKSLILKTCFRILGKNLFTRQQADRFIMQYIEGKNVSSEIVTYCLEFFPELADQYAKQLISTFSDSITSGRVMKGSHTVIRGLMKHMSDEEVRSLVNLLMEDISLQLRARHVERSLMAETEMVISLLERLPLKQEDHDYLINLLEKYLAGTGLPQNVVLKCMDLIADPELKQSYAGRIVEMAINEKIDNPIVISSCLKALAQTPAGEKYCRYFIENRERVKLDNSMISACIHGLIKDPYICEFSKHILDNSDSEWYPVWTALYACAMHGQKHPRIDSIINSFNDEMKKPRNERDVEVLNQYFNLLKIPFFFHPPWARCVDYVLKNWNRTYRECILALMFVYHDQPHKLLHACSEILKAWETEMHWRKTWRWDYVRHVARSLGHPGLRDLARETAAAIIRFSENPDCSAMDNHLINVARAITEEDKFPEWGPAVTETKV